VPRLDSGHGLAIRLHESTGFPTKIRSIVGEHFVAKNATKIFIEKNLFA
jgi:hypothetical protein